MTYFCWFWLFCWCQHDNMIIYSFYVWFFNSSYWVLPVYQTSCLYHFSIKSYRGWLNPPDIWDPKSSDLIGLIGPHLKYCTWFLTKNCMLRFSLQPCRKYKCLALNLALAFQAFLGGTRACRALEQMALAAFLGDASPSLTSWVEPSCEEHLVSLFLRWNHHHYRCLKIKKDNLENENH